MRNVKYWFLVVILMVVWACSTEKNTFISRAYHGTTAHYNGYFNANDLLNEAMKNYKNNSKEDFYSILPVFQLPSEEEVKNMYTPIDTAISKCTKVIQRHAMPSMDKPSAKKEEHNRWIDENWITIGVANFYRRDYDLAFKNFEYTKKFFSRDKSAYIAEMWMARAYMEQGKFTEANFAISNLEKAQQAMEDGASAKDTKTKSSKSKKKSKKKSKEKEMPPFPKKLSFDLALTRAVFCEKKKDKEGEIKALTKALEHAKKSVDKARVNFILGQLYEVSGDRGKAAEHYKKVLKYNAGYEMSFNASLKNALNAGGPKVRKNLNKMLRDTKNMEFKDQIYYTLAKMDLNDGEEQKAKENFTRSAFYSTTNPRQKGMAYESLGDMSFSKKEYVSAQKYYDSCAKVIPQTYPNYEAILNKASKLERLVRNLEIAEYEDSVQRIAKMPESDRLIFAENVIKKLKKEEEERQRQDAIRLAALQEIQSKKAASNSNGSKFYWNNEKTKQEGYEEFKRLWGQRENENDWRRSEKVVFASFQDQSDTSSTASNSQNTDAGSNSLDSLTAEMLVANLPLSDTALAESRERMMNAYYESGLLYYEQLNERDLAEGQYKKAIAQEFESDIKMMSAFQIYKMHQPNESEAVAQRDYILINYPTSDYAGFLRDPDYFLKKKERERITLEAYLTDLDRYERGLYYPVVNKANTVLAEDKDNPYRSKYILLKAMAQAKMYEDKTMILPTLDTLIALYPNTPESAKALEMKNIIKNGYSKNELVDFNKESIYSYEEDVPMMVLIFLTEKINNVVAKTRVIDFNKEYFGRQRLSVVSRVLKEDNVIIVKEFKDEIEAASYVSFYKKTRNHLLDMQKLKILYISQKNLATLFETLKLDEYQLYYDEHH